MASPVPRAAPVTIATLPARRAIGLLRRRGWHGARRRATRREAEAGLALLPAAVAPPVVPELPHARAQRVGIDVEQGGRAGGALDPAPRARERRLDVPRHRGVEGGEGLGVGRRLGAPGAPGGPARD